MIRDCLRQLGGEEAERIFYNKVFELGLGKNVLNGNGSEIIDLETQSRIITGSFRWNQQESIAEVVQCCFEILKKDHQVVLVLLCLLAQLDGIQFDSNAVFKRPMFLKILGALNAGTTRNKLNTIWDLENLYETKFEENSVLKGTVMHTCATLDCGPLYYDYAYVKQRSKFSRPHKILDVPQCDIPRQFRDISNVSRENEGADSGSHWPKFENLKKQMLQPPEAPERLDLFGSLVNKRNVPSNESVSLQFPKIGDFDPIQDFVDQQIQREQDEKVSKPKPKSQHHDYATAEEDTSLRHAKKIIELEHELQNIGTTSLLYRPQQLFGWEEQVDKSCFTTNREVHSELEKAVSYLGAALLAAERGRDWFENDLQNLGQGIYAHADNFMSDCFFALIGIGSETFTMHQNLQQAKLIVNTSARAFALSRNMSQEICKECAQCGNVYLDLVVMYGSMSNHAIVQQCIAYGLADHHRCVLELSRTCPGFVHLCHEVQLLSRRLTTLYRSFTGTLKNPISIIERFHGNMLQTALATFTIERYILDFSLSPLVHVLSGWVFSTSDASEYFSTPYLKCLRPGEALEYSNTKSPPFEIVLPHFFQSRRYQLRHQEIASRLVHCGHLLRCIRNFGNASVIITLITALADVNIMFFEAPPSPIQFTSVQKVRQWFDARTVRIQHLLRDYTKDMEKLQKLEEEKVHQQYIDQVEQSRKVQDDIIRRFENEARAIREEELAKKKEQLEAFQTAAEAARIQKMEVKKLAQQSEPDMNIIGASEDAKVKAEEYLLAKYGALLQQDTTQLQEQFQSLVKSVKEESMAISTPKVRTSVKMVSRPAESRDESIEPFKPSVRIVPQTSNIFSEDSTDNMYRPSVKIVPRPDDISGELVEPFRTSVKIVSNSNEGSEEVSEPYRSSVKIVSRLVEKSEAEEENKKPLKMSVKTVSKSDECSEEVLESFRSSVKLISPPLENFEEEDVKPLKTSVKIVSRPPEISEEEEDVKPLKTSVKIVSRPPETSEEEEDVKPLKTSVKIVSRPPETSEEEEDVKPLKTSVKIVSRPPETTANEPEQLKTSVKIVSRPTKPSDDNTKPFKPSIRITRASAAIQNSINNLAETSTNTDNAQDLLMQTTSYVEPTSTPMNEIVEKPERHVPKHEGWSQWSQNFESMRDDMNHFGEPNFSADSRFPKKPYQPCASFDVAMEVGLIEPLLEQCKLVDMAMVTVLKCHTPLLKHLQHVTEILLMGKGDFFQSIISGIVDCRGGSLALLLRSECVSWEYNFPEWGFSLVYESAVNVDSSNVIYANIVFDWPLRAMMAPGDNARYAQVHQFLLKVKYMHALACNAWKVCRERQMVETWLVLYWHHLRHFCGNFEEYLLNQIHHVTGKAMCQSIGSCETGPAELVERHKLFLDSFCRCCFLDDSRASGAITRILDRIFQAVEAIFKLTISEEPLRKDDFQKSWDIFSKSEEILLRALDVSAIPNSAVNSTYVDLLSRVDFSNYYSARRAKNIRAQDL